MSLNVEKLGLVRVIDPRTDINNQANRTYGVFESGGENTFKTHVSTSFNNSQINFTCNPPNPRIYVNRVAVVRAKFILTFQGQSAGAGIPLLQAGGLATAPGVNGGVAYYDAPRAYPLGEAMVSCQVTMNNDNLTSNVNTYSRALNRYHNDKVKQDHARGSTPSMPDMSQEYGDLDGFALSPLNGYGNNTAQCPRGGFVGAIITRNDDTGAPGDVATVELEVFEPIYLSPFHQEGGDDVPGFIQLQTMEVILQLGGRGVGALTGLASSLWSHSKLGSALTSATADVIGADIQFNYITPDITQPIPDVVHYSYFDPTRYPTTSFSPVPAGAVTSLEMNTVQLKSIPNRMYIFVTQRDQDIDISSTDTFFSIENLNITFQNRDGLLANATQHDLYQMSRKNGLEMSWRQFTSDVGAVVCVSFGADLPLGALQAPGLRGSYALSMRVRARNLKGYDVTPTLSVVVIQEGVLTIDQQTVTRSLGVLTPDDVLKMKDAPPVAFQRSDNVYGSGFFDKIWAGIKKALPVAKKIARAGIDVGKKAFPGDPRILGADALARSFGFGYGEEEKAPPRRRGRRKGGRMVGGQQLSSAQLRRLLE
jgi:hypothetical protein